MKYSLLPLVEIKSKYENNHVAINEYQQKFILVTKRKIHISHLKCLFNDKNVEIQYGFQHYLYLMNIVTM